MAKRPRLVGPCGPEPPQEPPSPPIESKQSPPVSNITPIRNEISLSSQVVSSLREKAMSIQERELALGKFVISVWSSLTNEVHNIVQNRTELKTVCDSILVAHGCADGTVDLDEGVLKITKK